MVMSVFYIDFERAKDNVSDLQMAPGIDEKNIVFAPKNVCFPPYFPGFRGKRSSPNLRVQGWSASKVRWMSVVVAHSLLSYTTVHIW